MRLNLSVIVLPTHEFALLGTVKSTPGNTEPLSGVKLNTGGKQKRRHQIVEVINEDSLHQKPTGTHAVATFNGTTTGSMYTALWWALRTRV